MAYTKQTWATGDIVTAVKLNHMEDGIGSAVGSALFCRYNSEAGHLDKTFGEIRNAFDAGMSVIFVGNENEYGAHQNGMMQGYSLYVSEEAGEISVTGELTFANSMFFTDAAPSIEAADAEYPVMSD